MFPGSRPTMRTFHNVQPLHWATLGTLGSPSALMLGTVAVVAGSLVEAVGGTHAVP